MIRIVVADDHALVRDGISEWLAGSEDIRVVATAANGREAVEAVERCAPEVVLMDLAMPVLDGLSATTEIVQRWPEVRVIVLTTTYEPDRVHAVLNAGAAGYMLKDVEPAVLIASIRASLEGGVALSPRVAAQLVHGSPGARQASPSTLTPREREILVMIASGYANKQIGAALGISEKTVKAHCGRIFHRLGVTDRTQAAIWALQHNVTSD